MCYVSITASLAIIPSPLLKGTPKAPSTRKHSLLMEIGGVPTFSIIIPLLSLAITKRSALAMPFQDYFNPGDPRREKNTNQPHFACFFP